MTTDTWRPHQSVRDRDQSLMEAVRVTALREMARRAMFRRVTIPNGALRGESATLTGRALHGWLEMRTFDGVLVYARPWDLEP